MINLLPPEQKREILEEEKFKIILILGIILIIFLIIFYLFLLLIKTSILADLDAQKILLEERKREISFYQDLEEKIKNANLNLSKLNNFYKNQIYFTEIFEKISQIIPSGIYLTNSNFSQDQISLSGFSPSREILISFKENLEKEFKEVSYPREIWLKEKDINFTFNFKIKK